MISDFKRQTPDTIFHFLSQLGQEEDVYSAKPEDLCPTLQDMNVYVYAKDQEMVLVMIDDVMSGTKEIAENQHFNLTEESYFRNISTQLHIIKGEKRVSPAWRLFHAGILMDKLIKENAEKPLKLHTMLITNSHIQNDKSLMLAFWRQGVNFDMTVLTDCQSFCDQWAVLKLPINPDGLLEGAVYMEAYRHGVERQRLEQRAPSELAQGWSSRDKRRQSQGIEDEEEPYFTDFADCAEQLFDDDDDDLLADDEPDSDDTDIDNVLLDEAAFNISTRLAACRSLQERKQVLLRYAKQKFFERIK